MQLPAYGEGLAASEADAQRFWDALFLHRTALGHDEIIAGRWVAIALADGSSDRTAYDRREDAIRHQSGDPNRYLYFRIPLSVPAKRECASILGYARRRYDAGWRESAAPEGFQMILPTRLEALQ